MKVRNMEGRNGNSVPNQFIITDDQDMIHTETFQSYRSIIAKIVYIPGKFSRVMLDSYYWDFSKTTGKYRNQFLGETKAETQKKIDSGEYKLTDLN